MTITESKSSDITISILIKEYFSLVTEKDKYDEISLSNEV